MILMKNWDSTALVTTEYNNLRAEILKRVEIRYQLLAITVTVFGALLAFVSQTKNAIPLLFYPMLALCIAISWLSNQQDIWKLSDYIINHIEVEAGKEHMHWEGYSRNLSGKEKRTRQFLAFGNKGIFVLTELFALLVGIILAITQPESNNTLLVLIGGCFSFLFTIATAFLLFSYKRGSF
jgi:hypothetical protein